MSDYLNKMADFFFSAMGQRGGMILNDTTAITGNFRIIVAKTDTVFALLTSDITKNGVAAASVAADHSTLLAGSILYGRFTAVTLTSGSVYLYK
jgi:hypothetical protein